MRNNKNRYEIINSELWITCRVCGEKKKCEYFIKQRSNPHGYSTICKECKKIESTKNYMRIRNNPELWKKALEQRRIQKQKHRDEINLKNYEYNHRPEVIERKAKWAREHTNITVLTEEQYRKKMWRNAKNRAEQKGLNFDITLEDVVIPKYCPILHTELILNKNYKYSNPEHTPSLDRIFPKLGYVKGNVQVISFLANTMKQNASKELLLEFCKNISEYLKSAEDIVRTTENDESVEIENKESQC